MAAPTLWYDFIEDCSLSSKDGEYGPTLTLTRATNATVVDDDGYIQEVEEGDARFEDATYRRNYANRTEDLTGWNTLNTTTVAAVDSVLHNSTIINLSSITDDATSGHHVVARFNVLGQLAVESSRLICSCYVKGDTGRYVTLSIRYQTVTPSIFDTQTGTWTTESATYSNHEVVNLGGGAYRISFVYTGSSSGENDQQIGMSSDGSTFNYSGSGETVLAGGYMVEVDPTNSRTSPATYIARGDTSDIVAVLSGSNNGLLVEEARTNILLQSEDFSTTWTLGPDDSVVNTNQTVAPDRS